MDAHHRQRAPQHLTNPRVMLQLRCRKQNAINTPLHQETYVALAIGALHINGANNDTLILATCLTFGPYNELSQHMVAKIAGDYPDSPCSLADQTAYKGIR